MRSLLESLSEYGDVMLRTIAEQWQAPAAEPAALAATMLEPERLRAFVAALPAEARAALAQVINAGGAIRGHLLTARYGELRRLGPRAIEREQPWRQPAGATERLWYAGLLFRRYGRLGNYHGEVYYIPPDLLAILPGYPAAGAPAIALTPVAVEGPGQEARDDLALDLATWLAHLRCTPALLLRDGSVAPSALAPLSQRWRGPADPERLALLVRLAVRTRLAVRRGMQLGVGNSARAWLEGGAFERQQALFDAWRSDPRWNELRRVPSLRCEDTGWRNDPLAARASVVEALRRLPEGWLRLGDFIAAMHEAQPDFARPDGDYDSWYIRDAATGQYLSGFAHWEDVEGALIRHLVLRPLYWLGAVALSEPSGPSPCFRITPWGWALLRLAAAPPEPEAAPIAVSSDLRIAVPRGASAYDRVRIERFARWQGRERDSDLYQLDPEAVWQAQNSGIQATQIASFLQRASGAALPPEAVQTLKSWGQGFGRITLRRAILLQTANAETLRQLKSDPELAQRFGAAVSDRAILVPEDQLARVLERLKTLGHWPRLEGLPEAPPE